MDARDTPLIIVFGMVTAISQASTAATPLSLHDATGAVVWGITHRACSVWQYTPDDVSLNADRIAVVCGKRTIAFEFDPARRPTLKPELGADQIDLIDTDGTSRRIHLPDDRARDFVSAWDLLTEARGARDEPSDILTARARLISPLHNQFYCPVPDRPDADWVMTVLEPATIGVDEAGFYYRCEPGHPMARFPFRSLQPPALERSTFGATVVVLDDADGRKRRLILDRTNQGPAFASAWHGLVEHEVVGAAVAFTAVAERYRLEDPKPELPEDARRFKVQAEAAVREQRYADAAEAFRAALRLAPWWPQGRFNRALLLAELGRHAEAVEEMRRYLMLVPDAANARQAQDKIYEWEALAQRR